MLYNNFVVCVCIPHFLDYFVDFSQSFSILPHSNHMHLAHILVNKQDTRVSVSVNSFAYMHNYYSNSNLRFLIIVVRVCVCASVVFVACIFDRSTHTICSTIAFHFRNRCNVTKTNFHTSRRFFLFQ